MCLPQDLEYILLIPNLNTNTGNDRYSGDPFSGNDGFSGTKTPDDAILFTVSGITAIVEQKIRIFTKILMRCSIFTVI